MRQKRPPIYQSQPEHAEHMQQRLASKDPELAALVADISSHAPDSAYAAGLRARLDAWVAAEAAAATRSLRRATWALVLLTAVLAAATIVDIGLSLSE